MSLPAPPDACVTGMIIKPKAGGPTQTIAVDAMLTSGRLDAVGAHVLAVARQARL